MKKKGFEDPNLFNKKNNSALMCVSVCVGGRAYGRLDGWMVGDGGGRWRAVEEIIKSWLTTILCILTILGDGKRWKWRDSGTSTADSVFVYAKREEKEGRHFPLPGCLISRQFGERLVHFVRNGLVLVLLVRQLVLQTVDFLQQLLAGTLGEFGTCFGRSGGRGRLWRQKKSIMT